MLFIVNTEITEQFSLKCEKCQGVNTKIDYEIDWGAQTLFFSFECLDCGHCDEVEHYG